MIEKSNVNSNQAEFYSAIPDYNNEQLINVLKKRTQYQKEAREIAIREAIKRGIINSEQDLFAKEFNDKPQKFSIFPVIDSDDNRNKIRKSIARVLLIIGSLPVVWGVIRIVDNELFEGILLSILGCIWIFASIKLLKKMDLQKVFLLFVMLFLSVVYIVKLFFTIKTPTAMDYLIPAILYSLVIYALLLLRKLH